MFSHPSALDRVVHHLRTRREAIVTQWNRAVEADPRMRTPARLTRREFKNNMPQVLEAFEAGVLALGEPETETREEAARSRAAEVEAAAQKHGAHRWQQGYSMEEVAREWGHIGSTLLDEIERFIEAEPDFGDALAARVRRLWLNSVSTGISASAARFDELGRSEAASRLSDLEGVLEKVRAFDRERGELLRQASHDLRGSLSLVQGAASLLDPHFLERMKGDDLAQLVQMLNSGVNALSEMMGELLDLARLEAEQEKRALESFNVAMLLSELSRTIRPLAENKGLSLRTEGPPSLFVENDRTKVNRIAQNLLLNAIKYTESGAVCLAWNALQEGDAHHWELTVSDTGAGLADSQSPVVRALQTTTQESREIGASIPPSPTSAPLESPSSAPASPVEPNASRIVSGTGEGVGLSIVKRLCEMLDAVLELESGAAGSTFRIVFPLAYS